MNRKIPIPLTKDDQEKLLQQPKKKSPLEYRNYCIIRLSLDIGTRCAETLAVKLHDINWNTGAITIKKGKGGKQRQLWFSENLLLTLKDFLSTWKKTYQQTEFLFSSGKGKALQPSYVRAMMKRYVKKADLDPFISYHNLRHTFATDLLRETKNIRLVQKSLGHSDLSTTMIYTHIVDEELETALRSLREEDSQPTEKPKKKRKILKRKIF